MSMMTYKGYDAFIAYDAAAGLFHGEVVNLRNVCLLYTSDAADDHQ